MDMPTDEFVHVMLSYFMQRIRPMHREYHEDFIEDPNRYHRMKRL